MEKLILALGILLLTTPAIAQTDTTAAPNGADTIQSGNFIIINDNADAPEPEDNGDKHVTIDVTIKKNNHDHDHQQDNIQIKKKNIRTNFLILDLGFANFDDQTDYSKSIPYIQGTSGQPQLTQDDLDLITGKSSNVNIWLFMQRLNVTKSVLNLKYGLGLEMFNFRYKNNITYNDNPPSIFKDSIDFSKNKLYVGYLTVPLMVNIIAEPDKKQSFSLSAGVSAGYKIGSRNKQVSDEKGKQKIHGDFDLDPWRFAYIAEVGLGIVRLYGSYSINPLHQQGLKHYPYTVGIRLSNW